MKTISIRCVILILLVFQSSVLAGPPEGYSETDERPQLGSVGVGMNGRQTWLLNNYQNYAYTLEQSCRCALPKKARVYVLAGKVAQVEDAVSGQLYVDPKMLKNFRTMAGYIKLIDELVSRHPDSLSIRYNRHLGYPELIKADLSYHMADEEVSYKIVDFKFLKSS